MSLCMFVYVLQFRNVMSSKEIIMLKDAYYSSVTIIAFSNSRHLNFLILVLLLILSRIRLTEQKFENKVTFIFPMQPYFKMFYSDNLKSFPFIKQNTLCFALFISK
jgi:hypothetical protein